MWNPIITPWDIQVDQNLQYKITNIYHTMKNAIRFFRTAALPTEARIGDIYFIYEGVPTIYIYKGGEEPWEAYIGRIGEGGDINLSDYATRTWVLQQLIPIWQQLEWDTETIPEGISIEDLLNVELNALNNKSVIGAINDIKNQGNYPIRLVNADSIYANPKEYNIWTSGVTPTTLDFNIPDTGVANEYIFVFSVTNTLPSISFEYNITWANDDAPVWYAGWTYEISIVIANGVGLASYQKFPTI